MPEALNELAVVDAAHAAGGIDGGLEQQGQRAACVLGGIVSCDDTVGVVAQDKFSGVSSCQGIKHVALVKSLFEKGELSVVDDAGHGKPRDLDVRIDGKRGVADIAHVVNADPGFDADLVKDHVMGFIIDSGGEQVVVVLPYQGDGQNLYIGFYLLFQRQLFDIWAPGALHGGDQRLQVGEHGFYIVGGEHSGRYLIDFFVVENFFNSIVYVGNLGGQENNVILAGYMVQIAVGDGGKFIVERQKPGRFVELLCEKTGGQAAGAGQKNLDGRLYCQLLHAVKHLPEQLHGVVQGVHLEMKIKLVPVAHEIQNTELDNLHGEESDLAPAVAGLDDDHVLVFFIYMQGIVRAGLSQHPLSELLNQSIV